jgi:hypothetical protein
MLELSILSLLLFVSYKLKEQNEIIYKLETKVEEYEKNTK